MLRRCTLLLLCAIAIVMIAGSCLAGEVRGAWLSAWSPGYFTADQVDATVAAAKSADINALFIQVRKNADSYYDSKIEPRAREVAPDFDPLAYTIQKAHAQGIKVHAWVNAYRVWTAKTAPPDPNHIVNLHPDWINKSFDGQTRASEGIYLDPGVPAAREYIASIVVDIATRYNVDGIQWDYIRYPGREWGYSDAALNRYYAETGATTKPDPKDPKWLQWKRDQVTELVKMVEEKVHAIKPKLVLSASTIPWGDCPADFRDTSPYAYVCQDWRLWLSKGYIDVNLPMNYKVEKSEKSARMFRNWLDGFARWSSGKPTYVGIDVTANDNAGVLSQIKAVRDSGLQGYVLFAFNQSQRRTSLVEAMGGKPTSTPAADEVVVTGGSWGDAQIAFDQGVKYAGVNQLGLAKVQLQKAISLDPKYTEAYFRLGRCYLRERNLAKAQEMFEKTLSLDSSHAGAAKELAALKKDQ